MPRQLRLSLRRPASFRRQDFVAGPSNAVALAAVNAWPNWHGGCLALAGPEGVGKSHLARIWAAETGAAIRAALTPATACVLVDCITLLASNVLLTLPETSDEATATAALNAEIDLLLAAYAASAANWYVVSNEVGLGIVPAYPLGRLYRDALGRANQRLAVAADRVLFMVAGLPLTLK
jgi:hypothetical protein